MNENEALLRLRTLLKPRLAQLGVAEKDVADTLNLTRSGVLDSFALMDLLAEAETAFGAQLDLDVLAVEDFATLRGMARSFAKALKP